MRPGVGAKLLPLCGGVALHGEAGEQGAGLGGQRHYSPVLIELQCPAQAGFGLVERPSEPVHLCLRHQELGPFRRIVLRGRDQR